MASSMRLIAATEAMRELLVAALSEHGVSCTTHGNVVTVDSAAQADAQDSDAVPKRVVSLLREVLSAPERDAVSVAEDLTFPGEFPVTTRLEAWWRVFETSWFDKAVAAGSFSTWFQPIVDTTVRRTIGYECLLRLTKGHRREGAEIMGAAAARRDLRGFDAYTRHLAIRTVAEQPHTGTLCFLNFIPSAIYRPAFCMKETLQLLAHTGIPADNFVFEAVESCHNPDFDHLRRIGAYLREEGLGFALDDVATNADALRLICELRPDYIKLDKRLPYRMDQPREVAAVRKLVDVAEHFGVRVIAKNVERVSAMENLWAAGVQCMQGYLFGSPAPQMSATPMDLVRLARAIRPSPQPDGAGHDTSRQPEDSVTFA